MKKIYTLIIPVFFACAVMAQTPVIEYQQVVTGLSEPVDVVNAGDGTNRLFIVQREGLIRIWNGSSLLQDPFLNVASLLNLNGGERGLLSMVFHPGYATNRYFFIYYTNTNGSLTLARYRTLEANPNQADPASGVVLLTLPHANNNHNGAKLNFGSDGFLYFGTGDGGGSNDVPNNAQNGNSLLGKMLRIDVNDFEDVTPPLYEIPAGNPYIGNAAVADEIIALGLRNPWRWSFDRLTGDMWIGDVGQNTREEIDFRRADFILQPTNYGWRCLEGSITNPNMTAACPPPTDNVLPVLDYPHNSEGGFVITGGYVYRGAEFPVMEGYYITADFSTGNIWLIKPADGGGWEVTPQIINKLTNVSSFGEDENGILYALRLNNGTPNTGGLYKVITGTLLAVKLLLFTADAIGSMHEIKWKTADDKIGNVYLVERKNAGENNFIEVDRKTASGQRQQYYSVRIAAASGNCYYRVKMTDVDGSINYSPVALIQKNTTGKDLFTLYKAGEFVSLQLYQPASSVQILNAAGIVLYRQSLKGRSGTINLPVTNYNGIFFVQVITENATQVKKLVW